MRAICHMPQPPPRLAPLSDLTPIAPSSDSVAVWRYSDNGPLGSATISRAEERRVENLKNLGYNAIRTSHNPVSPAFLDACDRLGVLVMHEAFDCFENGKNTNDYHVYFDAWWRRDLATMVRRSQNHPSIVLWSIGTYEYHNQSQPLITASLVHHSIQ